MADQHRFQHGCEPGAACLKARLGRISDDGHNMAWTPNMQPMDSRRATHAGTSDYHCSMLQLQRVLGPQALASDTWRSRLAALAAQGRGLQAQQVTSLPALLARWPICGCSYPDRLRQAAGDLQQSSLQVLRLYSRQSWKIVLSCRQWTRRSSERWSRRVECQQEDPCLLHCWGQPVGRLRIVPNPGGPVVCTPA
jgi:hypothetical protein